MMNAVEIKNVVYKYKGGTEDSLKGVSLSVKKGETMLLCGASGSGKTSVIRLINGLIPHYYNGEVSGEVNVAGFNVAKTELFELAGVVGTVFQNPRSQFFSVDTYGEIVFGPENIGLAPDEITRRAEMVINQMDIETLMGRSLFELSGGEKQMIACASVAALLPDIILLDEPSSNLDWDAIKKLREIIKIWKEQGKTIIISEHRLWYLKDLVERVIYMDSGKIAHEWSGDKFMELTEDDTNDLKLRPTIVKEELVRIFENNTGDNYGIHLDTLETITLKGFYFSYHHKTFAIWKKPYSADDGKDLNLCIPMLTLPKGKVIGVIGKNGTGKSTFLRCICGLEKDCTGSIICDDMEYKKKNRIGFSYMVMQDVNHQLFADSVEAEIMISMKEKNEKRCHEILDSLGLLACKNTHPMALSGGQKQRVAIASAIAAGARLLLFDEPTSGLDYGHMKRVGELLRELVKAGSTVLVSTHDPEFIAECCDYLIRIDNGFLIS